MSDKIREWLTARHPSPKAESPMEALFSAALDFVTPVLPAVPGERRQQAPFGPYRVDFLFTIPATGTATSDKRLVVEIDGHDFHEKTKEQAQRDKERDRFMVKAGAEVLRYTGSEVWANPFACAEEVLARGYSIHFGMTPKEERIKAIMADTLAFLSRDAAA